MRHCCHTGQGCVVHAATQNNEDSGGKGDNANHNRIVSGRALRLGLLFVWLYAGFYPMSALADDYEAASAAVKQGHLAEAIMLFKSANRGANSADAQLHSLWGLADTYRQQGKNKAALATLDKAARLTTTQSHATANNLRLGGIYYAMGRYDEASNALEHVLKNRSRLSAEEQTALYLDLGNLAVEQNELRQAATHYQAAAELAKIHNAAQLQARAMINALHAKLDDKDIFGVEDQLTSIKLVIDKVTSAHAQRTLQLAYGDLYRRVIFEYGFPEDLADKAYAAFSAAMHNTQDPGELGYANGFMGRLYEDFQRFEEALAFTQKATFYAQQASASEQMYRWDWQAGRILRAMGRMQEAQDAYQRAVQELNKVKPNLALGSRRTFNQLVSPVYTQYADVMLQRTAVISGDLVKQSHLGDVRNLLETLKAAEVEDYFANECVSRIRALDAASVSDDGAAVIYPVFLDQRTEILVEAGGQLAQFTAPVGRNQITATIRRLRVNLERSTSGTSYLKPAQQLHQWLIEPALAFIQANHVNTLVVVPEGALRTIPLSALHDGKSFLVERFAIATTPGIQLTKQLQASGADNMLVGGLTEGVQGFAELPNVEKELNTISSIYDARTIQDSTFQLQTVESALQEGGFSVAHFATHGEFSQDHKKSFILTYDDKLTLDVLQQVLGRRDQSEPLDLLVLSACKTAAGDDRAALGLAGVAVQSGAQSALASLWYISDAATAELIEKFYTSLHLKHSKAESLRRAQLALLKTDQYKHPSYWAPYLLVGNWL